MSSMQKLKDFSIAEVRGDLSLFLEQRIEYSGDNPIYVGYNRGANAATDDETWYIIKMTYSGNNVTRVQLPDNGPQFKYAWDDRASLFS